MGFLMINQIPKGKNIFGKELGDPNLFKKGIQVKWATAYNSPTNETGSKEVKLWMGPHVMSSSCPKCHYYSAVEVPYGIHRYQQYGSGNSVDVWYHCEICDNHWYEDWMPEDEFRALYHRDCDLRWGLDRLIQNKKVVKASEIRELLKEATAAK